MRSLTNGQPPARAALTRVPLAFTLLLMAAAPVSALDKRTSDARATALFALNDNDCGALIDNPVRVARGEPAGVNAKIVLDGTAARNQIIEQPNIDRPNSRGELVAALSVQGVGNWPVESRCSVASSMASLIRTASTRPCHSSRPEKCEPSFCCTR